MINGNLFAQKCRLNIPALFTQTMDSSWSHMIFSLIHEEIFPHPVWDVIYSSYIGGSSDTYSPLITWLASTRYGKVRNHPTWAAKLFCKSPPCVEDSQRTWWKYKHERMRIWTLSIWFGYLDALCSWQCVVVVCRSDSWVKWNSSLQYFKCILIFLNVWTKSWEV